MVHFEPRPTSAQVVAAKVFAYPLEPSPRHGV